MRLSLSIIILAMLAAAGGCAELPIRDGELALTANSSATLEDMGVAKIKNQF